MDNQVGTTTSLLFHPWNTDLVMVDNADGISVLNYEHGKPIKRIKNTTPKRSDVSIANALQDNSRYHGFRGRTALSDLTPEFSGTSFTQSSPPLAGAPGMPTMSGTVQPLGFRGVAGSGLGSTPTGAPVAATLGDSAQPSPLGPAAQPVPTAAPSAPRVTQLAWVNEHADCMLATAAEDGIIRVWRNITEAAGMESLVTAFSAVPDIITSSRGSGLVMNWHSDVGHMVAGGNSRALRVWDLASERCIISTETGTESCITSIASPWPGGYTGVVGHGNGQLQMYDMRAQEAGGRAGRLMNLGRHRHWIVKVAFQRIGAPFQCFSGSVKGDLRCW